MVGLGDGGGGGVSFKFGQRWRQIVVVGVIYGGGGRMVRDIEEEGVTFRTAGPCQPSKDLNLQPPGIADRAKSILDTVLDGSVWEEPAIDKEFTLEAGDVTVTPSPQGPIVKYSVSFRAKLYKNWENTLIIKSWGQKFRFRALSSRLSRLWQLSSGFKLIDLEQNY
ncbi:hypothetical protein Tsubulata_023482 [Turnera subulata]|uniref:Uncharacterized protein n=1 Tax=Turnera subulata TaxID=218843 RepID=A0A9Q0J0T0_9ROSI|nr:hypothetical protein Tsubulata_023482 [Turnera subulata]